LKEFLSAAIDEDATEETAKYEGYLDLTDYGLGNASRVSKREFTDPLSCYDDPSLGLMSKSPHHVSQFSYFARSGQEGLHISRG
jgi:hypothetical protein